jgi:hypothetical protein
MTVRDLVRLLEDFDPDAEVRLAVQPSWPLRHNVAGVCAGGDLVRIESEVRP